MCWWIYVNLTIVPIDTILNSDGRKPNSPEACKKGSFVYLFFDKDDQLLYVGETGTSVKSRVNGDGSGSHFIKDWFHEVSTVKYYCTSNDDEKERKLVEQALSISLHPKYYGR